MHAHLSEAWSSFLNSFMPWPSLGQFRQFFGAKKISTIASINMISPLPKLNRANMGFSCIL